MTKKHDKKCPLAPCLRFPEFQNAGEWKDISLNEIASPVTDRATNGGNDPVLTLSAEHGVIAQGVYFNKKIAGNTSAFDLIQKKFLFFGNAILNPVYILHNCIKLSMKGPKKDVSIFQSNSFYQQLAIALAGLNNNVLPTACPPSMSASPPKPASSISSKIIKKGYSNSFFR